MSTVIRVDEVPVSDRVDFVEDLTSATWVPMECRVRYPATFTGRVRPSGLGAMQVSEVDTTPIVLRRTRRHISDLPPADSRRSARVVNDPALRPNDSPARPGRDVMDGVPARAPTRRRRHRFRLRPGHAIGRFNSKE